MHSKPSSSLRKPPFPRYFRDSITAPFMPPPSRGMASCILKIAIIALALVDRGKWIVPEKPVLNRKDGGGRLCVLEEKRIMSYTQAQQYIELGLVVIGKSSLENRVTHGFKRPGRDLLI